MHKEYLEQLIAGEPLSGFLYTNEGTSSFRIPGCLTLNPNGQVVMKLILEEDSPIKAGIDKTTLAVVNGQTVPPQEIPQIGFFESIGGILTLIQTGSPFQWRHLVGRPIEFNFSPQYVVAGTLLEDYWKTPASLRAEIGGLAQWMHDVHITRSISLNSEKDERTGNEKVRLETIDFPSFRYKLNAPKTDQIITIRPLKEHFRSRDTDEIGIRFRTVVETENDSASTWEEFLHSLNRFQDLVNLLSWRSFTSSNLEGAFFQNPDNNLAFWEQLGIEPPTPVGPWLKLFNSQFPATFGSPKKRQSTEFILPFADFNEESLTKWIQLREEKSHPLELFLQVINQPQMAPSVKALQLGAGLESLGFKIREAKTSKKKADKLHARQLFELVAEPALRIFPDEFETWATDVNEAYQAMKHLNRKLPLTSKIAETNDRTSLIVQIWLANELGASDSSIKAYVQEQPRLRSRYAKIPDPSFLHLDNTDEISTELRS
ncbi:reverse gyrase [[Brevibacterium] flavum]|uniref:Reverse gyrase n=1 Tax=[Brevibacterium] flavum TaxID=92706 RepID=A0A0F6Z4J0_9CORY|nr:MULTISPECIES: HEPN domain-containing protein [Corynebacterium]AKF26662.1 reverse gyrase [[Brevibacterium] flavum]ANE07483.1 reverse gyrase [Corynebacterium glutamicum]AST19899.1 reverse gyrase [Corynebacterium glutamicum ATCC 14067]KEI22362.1 reverse gyrase [Corynebacterium glutamicum ATCC 14067]KIH74630.1 reverse gyrase [Corynebacterium glutamicum]